MPRALTLRRFVSILLVPASLAVPGYAHAQQLVSYTFHKSQLDSASAKPAAPSAAATDKTAAADKAAKADDEKKLKSVLGTLAIIEQGLDGPTPALISSAQLSVIRDLSGKILGEASEKLDLAAPRSGDARSTVEDTSKHLVDLNDTLREIVEAMMKMADGATGDRQAIVAQLKSMVTQAKTEIEGMLPKSPPDDHRWLPLLTMCDYLSQTPATSDTTELVVFAAAVTADAIDNFKTTNKVDISPVAAANRSPAWAVGACALVADLAAQSVAHADEFDGHRSLVELDLTLSRLMHWSRTIGQAAHPVDADVVEARARLQKANADIHDFMKAHDLLNSFSAGLFAGTSFGGTNRVLLGTGSAAVKARIIDTDQSKEMTRVTIESTHFGWEGEHTLDGSFRAHAGFEPVLNVLSADLSADTTDTSTAAANPALVGVLQQAFVLGIGARIGMPLERPASEISLVVQVGTSHILADPVAFDDKKPALVAVPLGERSTRTAWFSDLGVEWNMYDNPIRVLHAEKGLVTPAVSVGAGYRYDGRFAAGNFDGLSSNPKRLYVRMMVDAIKTVTSRGVGAEPKAFDLGFGVEYERNFPGNHSQIPSSTRFLIRGEINLLKAAGGGEKPAAAAKK